MTAQTSADQERAIGRLRAYNLVMAALHAVQGVAIVLLSNDFTLPITAQFMEGPPGTPPVSVDLFDVPVGWAVAAFLFLSALAHLVVGGPAFGWYRSELLKNRNRARWIEYSISSSLMIVLIGLLTGIADVAAVIGLFGANAAMILFGWLMEVYEEPGRPRWTAYWFGVIAGAVPWIAIGVYLWSPGSAAEPPAFVYAIFVSLFLFFNSFAINMVLQYRRIGPWRNYLFGEAAYVLLSLTAKSALAWQVFAGTLAG